MEGELSKRAGSGVTQALTPQKVEISEKPKPELAEAIKFPVIEQITEKPKTTVEEAEQKPKLAKKSFNVNFNTKFSKNSGQKKSVASKKIDDVLDFNKMFLGDQIDDKKTTQNKPDPLTDLKQDFEFGNGAQSAPQNGGSFNFEEKKAPRKMSDEDKAEEMAKFSGHQGVGSDMINSQYGNNAPVSTKNYSNCQALSSDQLFGKAENGGGNSGGEFFGMNGADWQDKIRDTKDM